MVNNVVVALPPSAEMKWLDKDHKMLKLSYKQFGTSEMTISFEPFNSSQKSNNTPAAAITDNKTSSTAPATTTSSNDPTEGTIIRLVDKSISPFHAPLLSTLKKQAEHAAKNMTMEDMQKLIKGNK